MNGLKSLALILIAAGVIGLAYGGFTYTRQTHETKIGPVDIAVSDRHTVNIPVWAGVAAIIVGAGLLIVPVRSVS